MGIRDWFTRKKKREEKASTTQPLFANVGGMAGVVWTPEDYLNYSREGYVKNVVTFACTREIARSAASVPWKVFTENEAGGREEQPEHQLNKVLKRADPHNSFNMFVQKTLSYFLIAGNSYVERISPMTGPNQGIPIELHNLRPDRMTVIPDTVTGRIDKYMFEFQGKKKIWDVDPITEQADILHLKDFNPIDDFYGLGVVKPSSREIDTNNEGTEWNMYLLQNKGRPGMKYTFVPPTGEGLPGTKEFEKLKADIKSNYAGSQNAGKDIVLMGGKGTDVAPYTLSPAEMDWSEGMIATARNICMAYGVPPMLIGIPGEATFANYKEARLSFWENTVSAYLNYLKGELNNWIFGIEERLFIDYVLDNVSALSVRRKELWERAEKSTFITVNEKREMVGLGKYEESDKIGDEILVGVNQVPLGMEPEEEEMNNEGNDPDEEE